MVRQHIALQSGPSEVSQDYSAKFLPKYVQQARLGMPVAARYPAHSC